MVALNFSNIDVVAEWLAKARQAWAAFDLPTTVQFGDHLEELVQSVSFTVPVLLLLDRPRDVHALFRCWGFTCGMLPGLRAWTRSVLHSRRGLAPLTLTTTTTFSSRCGSASSCHCREQM